MTCSKCLMHVKQHLKAASEVGVWGLGGTGNQAILMSKKVRDLTCA